MAATNVEDRKAIASIAAHAAHAKHGSQAMTQKARDAFNNKFEQEVDPEGVLPPAERAKRAEHARIAHMQQLAYKAVKARRAKAAAKQGGVAA